MIEIDHDELKKEFDRLMEQHEKGLQEVENKKKEIQSKQNTFEPAVTNNRILNSPIVTSDKELVTRVFLVEIEVAKQLDELSDKLGRGKVSSEINELLKDYLQKQ